MVGPEPAALTGDPPSPRSPAAPPSLGHSVNSLQGDCRPSLGENSGESRLPRRARVCRSLVGELPLDPGRRRPCKLGGRRPARAPAAGKSAPAAAEGGAAAQVGQVGSLGSGVSVAAGGSDCFLAGAGGAKRTLGPGIQTLSPRLCLGGKPWKG